MVVVLADAVSWDGVRVCHTWGGVGVAEFGGAAGVALFVERGFLEDVWASWCGCLWGNAASFGGWE